MAKKGKYIYDFPRPMVTVDAVVFWVKKGSTKVLLIKRKNQPFKNHWAVPGGFIELDEELEDAAARELEEETSLINVMLKQIHTFGKCGRDPRGRQITVVFMGIITKKTTVNGGDDAAEAKWYDIDKLPGNLGFDHNEVLNYAIKKLKRTKIYQDNKY